MADKTAKTRFFRVAVAGMTASDGRTIEANWLTEGAAGYNPETYTARVNMEHIRGFSADGPFVAYGDVLALKTQTDDIEINGKMEKRLALYAQIDPTDQLVKYNQARQKIFTSIEIEPNFSGTGKAYVIGLAVTDSPASLGTEALQFSHNGQDAYAQTLKKALNDRKQHQTCLFSAAHETKIELETAASTADGQISPMEKALTAFANILTGNKDTKSPPPVQLSAPAADPAAQPNAALVQAFSAFSVEMLNAVKASNEAATQRFAKLESEFANLKGDIENTADRNHSSRPLHSGGDSVEQTDC